MNVEKNFRQCSELSKYFISSSLNENYERLLKVESTESRTFSFRKLFGFEDLKKPEQNMEN